MLCTVFLAVLFLTVQVFSLPVTNPTVNDDTKVMNCIIKVISDIVSKSNPLSVSQECLEILQRDERILSILRHQNLLKELQDIANQGATERTEQQKKNSGFEDELSEVLESQSNKNSERGISESAPDEEPTASFAELQAENSWKNREKDLSRDERNSLEEREPRARDTDFENEKEHAAAFESNEVGETEELPWDDAVDNHIRDDIRDDETPEERRQEDEDDAAEVEEMEEFEDERERATKNSQEESKEERERNATDQEEEEEDDEEEEDEEERGASEEEHPTSSEDKDDQREDDNQDTKEFERDETHSKEKGTHHDARGGKRSSPDERRKQEEEVSHSRDTGGEEAEEGPSRDLEDAKRWNKMDELAKQLTSTKRAEEAESDEDPDQSMKLALKPHKNDFHNSEEEEVGRPQRHHSKEERSEGSFPIVGMPEEKKDEEGSAHRTEDQELESLAAIEAELEKVAHKLHALRRG